MTPERAAEIVERAADLFEMPSPSYEAELAEVARWLRRLKRSDRSPGYWYLTDEDEGGEDA